MTELSYISEKSTPSNVHKPHHSRHASHGASPARLDESPSDFQPVMASTSRQQLPPQAPPSHPYLPPEARVKRPPTSCSKSSQNNGDVTKENPRLKARRVTPHENSESKARSQQQSTDEGSSLVKGRASACSLADEQSDLRQRQPPQRENVADILPDRFDRLRVADESNVSRPGVVPTRRPSPEQTTSESKLVSSRLVDDFLPVR